MTAVRVRAPGNTAHGTPIPACQSRLLEIFGIGGGQ